MQSYDNRAAIEAAPTKHLNPKLLSVLLERIKLYRKADLLDRTHILVINPADTEQAIVDAIGFSPLVNSIDGVRYGSVDFHPYWDGPIWRHDGCYELIITVGNSGFAFILLVADADGVLPELLDLCRTYAGQ